MQQAFKKMFEDGFISEFFSVFFWSKGIPKYCIKWVTARGYNTDYGGLMWYL